MSKICCNFAPYFYLHSVRLYFLDSSRQGKCPIVWRDTDIMKRRLKRVVLTHLNLVNSK